MLKNEKSTFADCPSTHAALLIHMRHGRPASSPFLTHERGASPSIALRIEVLRCVRPTLSVVPNALPSAARVRAHSSRPQREGKENNSSSRNPTGEQPEKRGQKISFLFFLNRSCRRSSGAWVLRGGVSAVTSLCRLRRPHAFVGFVRENVRDILAPRVRRSVFKTHALPCCESIFPFFFPSSSSRPTVLTLLET